MEQPREFPTQCLILPRSGSGFTGQCADLNLSVWFVPDNIHNLDAAESLQKEIGGAIVILLTRANNPNARDSIRRLEMSFFFDAIDIKPCHREQAIGRQYVAQHLSITRLKN